MLSIHLGSLAERGQKEKGELESLLIIIKKNCTIHSRKIQLQSTKREDNQLQSKKQQHLYKQPVSRRKLCLKLTWVNFWTIAAEFWEREDDWTSREGVAEFAGTVFVITELGSGTVPGRGTPTTWAETKGKVPVTDNPADITDSAGWSHFLFFLLESRSYFSC